ncbi:hypothetical protein E0Z10_g4740 [Xylaria hypoxylon]|uniref:Zn(2)-C6 fungal-type domain-containing protein n=1 Tax=Xylaria hypoxylon TaxID=37992 RepID=A0A4Z0YVV2_9PEZI|nr:hypothetical protein E0Z10_g4740 [Xylaria hypoxylon]
MATFTALNGTESKASDGTSGSPTMRHVGSEDRSTIQVAIQGANSGEVPVTQVARSPGSGLERSHYQSKGFPEVEGTHKRKRSVSVERYERSREATSTQDQDQRSQAEPRGAYEVSRERDYRHYGEDQREQGELWSSQQQSRDDRNLYESRDPAGSVPTQADEQSGDGLRRATSQAESVHDYSATSPDGDESSMMYSGAYSQDQSRDPVIQSDPKKRKRNFSNRTKTGCLTCRKRKKKCDESKPECTNCVRGGFVCYGYPNQRGPPRMENKPAAVPLESKDPSYVPPGAYGMPQPSTYPNPPPAPAPKRDSVSYRGPYLRLETSQARPVLTDDDRPTASTLPTASVASSVMSPDNKASAFSYSSGANMFPTPISAITPSIQQLKTPNIERTREYQRVPPLHDLTRTDPDSSRPQTPRPGPLPQMNVLEPTPTPVSSSQPLPSTDPQIAAQLALSHTQYSSNNNKPRTQKEEMLLSREYYPFDPELMLERQRCSAACWRFNNSTNPNTGVSATERSRLFREILNPREPIHLSPQMISSTTRAGRVGQEVVVEAPFTCDYGYNITIGNNVMIGRNCTILDPVEITIGDNCIIGPNVTLLGSTTFTDPKKRDGSRSPHIGGYIIIDEDVWIGAGAIIQHGIRIGRGASVSAGAVVVKARMFHILLSWLAIPRKYHFGYISKKAHGKIRRPFSSPRLLATFKIPHIS